ncbi:cyclic-phosphate processing receiver domain-containing protein, partial [Holdemanella biformis]
MKIFVDDKRDFSEVQLYGYNCVRTYKQCITLLSVFKDIDAINLDYDLGGECITLLSVFKDIDAINLDYDLGGEETG